MKNPILLTAMNTMLASALNAQPPMTQTTNWLGASREALGPGTAANWLLDLDADGIEVYVTQDHALVLVDRTPIVQEGNAAFLRKGVLGLGGTRLSLIGEVKSVDENGVRGTYRGLLGGTAVLMDQYVQLRNGVPVAIVRVISRVNGSAPENTSDLEDLALGLFHTTVDGTPAPVLTKK